MESCRALSKIVAGLSNLRDRRSSWLWFRNQPFHLHAWIFEQHQYDNQCLGCVSV
jgi:hypothetical protein